MPKCHRKITNKPDLVSNLFETLIYVGLFQINLNRRKMNNIDGGCWTKPQTSDENDSQSNSRYASGPATAIMSTERNATHYNMNHKSRGHALIFNHETFKVSGVNMSKREGTNVDAHSMALRLNELDFEATVHQDLEYDVLMQHVTNAAKSNHTDNDCFVLVVLSHGDMDIVYARDQAYKIDDLWTPFAADLCTTLAGKPKLFFIQACRGDKFMPPVILNRTETDGHNSNSYKIPSQADFLFAYSNIPGYYSWRNTARGSWFIEALCKELEESAYKYDILTILTFVNRRVAIDYESYQPNDLEMHERKQIPCLNSRLTRLVQFNKKGEKLDNAVGNQNSPKVKKLTTNKVFLDY